MSRGILRAAALLAAAQHGMSALVLGGRSAPRIDIGDIRPPVYRQMFYASGRGKGPPGDPQRIAAARRRARRRRR